MGGGASPDEITGDLTAPKVPVATGPHTLGDSQLSETGTPGFGALDYRGTQRWTEDGGPGFPLEVVEYGLNGRGIKFFFSRGTEAEPLPVASGDVLGRFFAAGYNGSNFYTVDGITIEVDGDVGVGHVPSAIRMRTQDSDGNDRDAMYITPSQVVEVPKELLIKKITRKWFHDLAIVGGNVALSADDSDNFHLTLSEDAELSAPTGTPRDRTFLLRVKNDGAFTLGFHAIYRFSNNVEPIVTPGPDMYSYLGFIYNEDDDFWDCIGERLALSGGS